MTTNDLNIKFILDINKKLVLDQNNKRDANDTEFEQDHEEEEEDVKTINSSTSIPLLQLLLLSTALPINDTYFPVKIIVSTIGDTAQLYQDIVSMISSDQELLNMNIDLKKDIETLDSIILISVYDKVLAEKLYKSLIQFKDEVQKKDHKLSINFNYDGFISHPGNMFVKNLSTCLVSESHLYEFFLENSIYKSLNNVKLFPQENNESFAFLKFSNHLDVDYFIDLKFNNNQFHVDQKSIYINRYISKKERKLRQQSRDYLNEDYDINFQNFSISDPVIHSSSNSPPPPPSSILQPPAQNSNYINNNHDYRTIFVENLNQFISELNPSIGLIDSFLSKFEIFGKISSVYFPLIKLESNDVPNFKLSNVGYITFEYNESNENSLKALYYLNGLNYEEFFKFNKEDVYDILNDMISIEQEMLHEEKTDLNEQGKSNSKSSTSMNSNDDSNTNLPVLNICIAQHKHNHYLYEFNHDQYSFTRGFHDNYSTIDIVSPDLQSTILSTYLKKSNYQETNIYVNNFSILFNNDDILWESFWLQFGTKDCSNFGIKSAKIIKPQFYSSNKNGGGNKPKPESENINLVGKIGFVFYQNFKMAIKAILLTNGKTIIDSEGQMVEIQTSFAIQKNNGYHGHGNNQAHSQSFHHFYHTPLQVGSFSGSNKRFSLPSLLQNGNTNSNHDPMLTYPPGSTIIQTPYLPPPDFNTFFFNPYMNFNYGYQAFIPGRMSFEKETSPCEEDNINEEDSISPPNGYVHPPPPGHSYPFYLSPPVTSPIFKDSYTDGQGANVGTPGSFPQGPPPHPMMYGIPPSPGQPHMFPIYPYFHPIGVSNQTPKADNKKLGKKLKLKEK